MATLGPGVFTDDLATDLRSDFRDLIGEGLSPKAAVERLVKRYRSSLKDDDERPVFWLALAAVQWKLGRTEARTKREALRIIESGEDLRRWEEDPGVHKKRKAVLAELRKQLLSPPPPPKPVRRRVKETNTWSVGEVVGFRLQSGKWTLMRVIGHHEDRGGRFAVCELLRWTGRRIPNEEKVLKLPVRFGPGKHGSRQFLFQQPRKTKDAERVLRLGIVSRPSQECGGYAALVWPYVDRLFAQLFRLQ